MDFQSYPRYDMETVNRKVHAIIGTERMKAHDNLSEEEWERVFAMCAKEYTYRGIRLISARTMNHIEMLGANRVAEQYRMNIAAKYGLGFKFTLGPDGITYL